jgi:hypothetical protein
MDVVIIFGISLGVLLMFFRWFRRRPPTTYCPPSNKPNSPTKPKFITSEIFTKGKIMLKGTFSWELSTSKGIVSQHVKITVNGTVVLDNDFDANTIKVAFDGVPYNAVVVASVSAYNGYKNSEVATVEAVANDAPTPEAPTGLGIIFEESEDEV